MKRTKNHFVFFVFLLLSLQNIFAGEPFPPITGKVTSETGEALAGVSVAPKDKSAAGTTTNENGAFSINAPAGTKILVFSYVGFGTQEVDITGLTTVDVQPKAETNSLESIVVTGYQAIKKKDLLGAVSVVDVKDVKLNSSGNPLKGMQGRTAGIYVTSDGSPAGRASVMVRGATTISRDPGNPTDPAVAPLYIVDGVPMNSGFYNLSANDIESIQVLKDPSSASIYGSRAANGVIIVTTKGAEKKDGKVEFNAFMSSQRFTTPYSVLNAEERGRVLWQATMNDNKSTGTNTDPNANPIYDYEWHTDANGNPVLDRVIIPEWVDESKGIRSADTDWWDVISRPGFTQNYDLAFSKAGKTGSSRFSVNYYKNKGILKGTDFERITARLNSSYTILNGKVRVGENLSVAKGNESPTPGSVGGNVIDLALISQPILPIYTVNGGWAGPPGAGFDDRDNPYHAIVDNGLDQNQFLTVAGNAFAEVSILKNLTFRTNFGVEYTDVLNRDIEKKFIAGFLGSNINSLQLSQGHNVTWTWNNTLTYTLEKGKSNLSAFVGTETVKEQFTNFFTRREGFALETLDFMTIDAGTGTQTVGSWQNGRNFGAGGFQLLSYFGKVNYTWDERFPGFRNRSL